MKAHLEANDDGIMLIAETDEEKERLLALWDNGCYVMNLSDQDDSMLIAPHSA